MQHSIPEQDGAERGIQRLVGAAALHVKGFEECSQLIQALRRCGNLDWEVPENTETLRREGGEALRLAERIIEFTESRVPETD